MDVWRELGPAEAGANASHDAGIHPRLRHVMAVPGGTRLGNDALRILLLPFWEELSFPLSLNLYFLWLLLSGQQLSLYLMVV